MTYEDLYPITNALVGIENILKREYQPPEPNYLINDLGFTVQLIQVRFPLTYILVVQSWGDTTVENFRSKNDAVVEAVRLYEQFKITPKPENYND